MAYWVGELDEQVSEEAREGVISGMIWRGVRGVSNWDEQGGGWGWMVREAVGGDDWAEEVLGDEMGAVKRDSEEGGWVERGMVWDEIWVWLEESTGGGWMGWSLLRDERGDELEDVAEEFAGGGWVSKVIEEDGGLDGVEDGCDRGNVVICSLQYFSL